MMLARVSRGVDDALARCCTAALAAGEGTCELVGYDGAGHGFFNPSRDAGKWYEETLREMDRFLTRIGYLSEPASTGKR